jgi:hypothetical protein
VRQSLRPGGSCLVFTCAYDVFIVFRERHVLKSLVDAMDGRRHGVDTRGGGLHWSGSALPFATLAMAMPVELQ